MGATGWLAARRKPRRLVLATAGVGQSQRLCCSAWWLWRRLDDQMARATCSQTLASLLTAGLGHGHGMGCRWWQRSWVSAHRWL